MTSVIRGRSSPLRVEWYEYGGGPAAVVDNVIITITPLSGGIAIIGPTSTGVTNPATGINVYQWSVPVGLELGDYLVVWDGEDISGNPVQASEIVTVLAGISSRTSGPCSTWPSVWCCDLLEVASVSGTAIQMATEVLYSLSGRRFDTCPVELWPCRDSCNGGSWPFGGGWYQWSSGSGYYPQPALIAGSWFNITCGDCYSECSCSPLSRVKLPGPIIEVVEVRVDDVVLTQDVDYRLDDGRFLTRLGGESWPLCNDLSQTHGVGTWSVVVSMGETVPALGQAAVGELACQFAQACLGNDCELPKSVASLSRQGVTMEFLDPNALFKDGLTGLPISDMFINTYNPRRKPSRSRVYDIDTPPPSRLGS
jgi:hypothetical protein